MIRIADYKIYATSLKTRIATISRVKIVSTITQLEKWVRDLSLGEIVLIAIIPSADTNAPDYDNVKESNTCLFLLVKKIDPSDYSDDNDNEINDMQAVQDVMTDIKELMKADAENHTLPHSMHGLEINGMHTDPEWNNLGCNGWSLSFMINTNGF